MSHPFNYSKKCPGCDCFVLGDECPVCGFDFEEPMETDDFETREEALARSGWEDMEYRKDNEL